MQVIYQVNAYAVGINSTLYSVTIDIWNQNNSNFMQVTRAKCCEKQLDYTSMFKIIWLFNLIDSEIMFCAKIGIL